MNISSEEYRGWLRLDPRTKMCFVLTVGCFCLTLAGGNAQAIVVVRAILAFSSVGLLVVSGRWQSAFMFAGLMAACYALAALVLPYASGFIGWMLYASVGITTQMLPGAIAAYWMLSTTTASELVAALQRMHTPQAITIPLAVMFRFFPTAVAEQRAINDAMRMRGVRFGGGKASDMLEYRVVPLITNSVRIADELSQAALTRGLGASRHRTSIARIGFHAPDFAVIAYCLCAYAVWGLTAAGVLG
jgi:energy-coupling factor transport system permease protein